jgi:PAS domain S-box-containing protein
MSAILRSAPTALWVIGADGIVEFANPAAANLLGYADAGDVMGRPSHATLHHRRPDGSDYPAQDCPILRARQPGPGEEPRRAHAPEWFLTRTGSTIPVAWSTTPMDDSGTTLLTFDSAEDHAERLRKRAARDYPAVTAAANQLGIAPSRNALRSELLRQIHERFRDPDLTVALLAGDNHISVRTLQALFADGGVSPAAEIRRTRLDFARGLLERGAAVRRACFDSGFSDQRSFGRAFRRAYTVAPSHIRPGSERIQPQLPTTMPKRARACSWL